MVVGAHWKYLRYLNLNCEEKYQVKKIRDLGVIQLVRSNWIYLEEADLEFCELTDSSMQYFPAMAWPSLKTFSLSKFDKIQTGM